MITAIPYSDLTLVTAERDEYHRNWRDSERSLASTNRRLREALDDRDDLHARITAVLGMLSGDPTPLAADVRERLRAVRPTVAASQPVSRPVRERGSCPACGRDSALRLDGHPQAHRGVNGERCNGRSA